MVVKTEAQYYESLKKTKPTAYVLGEKIKNIHEHPLIKGQVASVAQTYALAHDPEGEKLLVAESGLIGEKVNRFVKLYESPDDLIAKVRMLKFVAQRTGTCFMRCTGLDAINSVAITTYDADKKYGTPITPASKNG